jgi:glyoxylase-like metal-dependent hydrolase (beta-lactamase superfamily II)
VYRNRTKANNLLNRLGGLFLKEVAPGIIVYDNPFGSSNVISITTTEGTIVIDASLFPSKAEQIKMTIQRLWNSEVTLVINTHYHPDHTFGNTGFNSPICCCTATEEFFRRMDKKYIQQVVEKEPLLEPENIMIVPPSLTFEKDYKLTYGDIELYLENVGGHTPDSVVIRIPKYGILVTGDLVVSGFHPEIVPDSQIKVWIKTLKTLKKERFKQIIPGHGPVVRDLEIDYMRSYLEKLTYLQEHKTQIETFLTSLNTDPNFKDRKMSQMFIENLKVVMNR